MEIYLAYKDNLELKKKKKVHIICKFQRDLRKKEVHK